MPSHHHHLIYTCVYTCVVVFEFSRCPAAALLHFPNYRCPVRTRETLDANNIKNHHNIEKHGRHRTQGVNALSVRNPLLWWPSMLHLLANNPRQPCYDACCHCHCSPLDIGKTARWLPTPMLQLVSHHHCSGPCPPMFAYGHLMQQLGLGVGQKA